MFPLSPHEQAWFWALGAPPLAVLAMVLLNLAVWPRGRAKGRIAGRVSVCIPARNEARSIVTCVRAVLAGTQRPDEVLVYDDGSTDGTGEILERLCETERALRVVPGGELPPGWLGKPWACHRLYEEAAGDVLVYLDADTVPTPTCLARLGWVLEHWKADLVTATPKQVTGTLTEQAVVPLLDLRFLVWPLPLVWRTRSPRIRVTSGQIMAVRREALARAGGWEAAAGEVADDAAMGKRMKEVGGRVVYAQGQNLATGRLFEGRADLWLGLSKIFYHRLVRRPVLLALALLLCALLFAPYVGLFQALVNGWRVLLWPSLFGVAANVAIRSATALRLRQSSSGILLHPLGLVWLFFIAINSFRLSRRGTLDWRGRKYSLGGRMVDSESL